jgi:hypothetical protein
VKPLPLTVTVLPAVVGSLAGLTLVIFGGSGGSVSQVNRWAGTATPSPPGFG